MTATRHRGPYLRWRPLPGTLIDRRGAALAPPILPAIARPEGKLAHAVSEQPGKTRAS